MLSLVLDLVLVVELSRESRVVIHVAMCTIHSFILGLLVESGNHCAEPLEVLLGFLLRHLLGLLDWTRMFF